MIKPTLPKGTRDFSPEVVRKRQYIFQVIRDVFEAHRFQPLETPAMENLTTLTGKYGEEGDKLMFRILDNGDIWDKSRQAKDNAELAALVCEKALRYDLTIPFARYVVMHQHELAFPFKRYQIQPVWRADRPQRGRYREFYQCDADVVGSDSLVNEAELMAIYDSVFSRLGLQGYTLRVNHRKILTGLAQTLGRPEALTEMTVAMDKLDKVGLEGVKAELSQRGFSASAIATIEQFLAITGDTPQRLQQLGALLGRSAAARQGIDELTEVLEIRYAPFQSTPVIDQSLARGLNYYTGIIIEAKAPEAVRIGSIGGGGRYDDLTGLFGAKALSGVGISFGVDRLYDVLSELDLFPAMIRQPGGVLFLQTDLDSRSFIFPLLHQLRQQGISAEMYPDPVKLDKQMKYANKSNIPFVVIAGQSERSEDCVSVKNMVTGSQEKVAATALVDYFKTAS